MENKRFNYYDDYTTEQLNERLIQLKQEEKECIDTIDNPKSQWMEKTEAREDKRYIYDQMMYIGNLLKGREDSPKNVLK